MEKIEQRAGMTPVDTLKFMNAGKPCIQVVRSLFEWTSKHCRRWPRRKTKNYRKGKVWHRRSAQWRHEAQTCILTNANMMIQCSMLRETKLSRTNQEHTYNTKTQPHKWNTFQTFHTTRNTTVVSPEAKTKPCRCKWRQHWNQYFMTYTLLVGMSLVPCIYVLCVDIVKRIFIYFIYMTHVSFQR